MLKVDGLSDVKSNFAASTSQVKAWDIEEVSVSDTHVAARNLKAEYVNLGRSFHH
jgi:hypothetical protein